MPLLTHTTYGGGTGGGGATAFTELTDAFAFAGNSLKWLRVNVGETALEPADISASDIGNGLVDDDTFDFLSGVTSSIQDQLDAKLTSSQPLVNIGAITPVRGDLITAQGAGATLAALATGALGTVLAGGTEPAWSATPTLTRVDGPSGGTLGLRAGSDGANAVQVQNAAGTSVLNVDTSTPALTFRTLYPLIGGSGLSSGNAFTVGAASGNELTGSNSQQVWQAVTARVNQSGTAGYTGLLLNVLETTPGTSIGSGTNRLLELQRESTFSFAVERDGTVSLPNDVWMRWRNAANDGWINALKTDTNNDLQLGAPLVMGPILLPSDSGAVLLVDMPVSDTNTHKISFGLDSRSLLSIVATGLSGGITNPSVLAEYVSADTNTVPALLRIQHDSTGTPVAGFGVGLRFEAKSGAATIPNAGEIDAIWNSVTGGAEESRISIRPTTGGALTVAGVMTISKHGATLRAGDAWAPWHASQTGTAALRITSGTAPDQNETDSTLLYSADITAGNAALHIRNESGNIIKIYRQAHIADAPGDTTANNATTINAILLALETWGLLATS